MNRMARELPNDCRQYRFKLDTIFRALREGPRLLRLNELVAASDAGHHALESFVQEIAAPALERCVILDEVRGVGGVEIARRPAGNDTVAILLDHRDRAACQVAKRLR